MVQALPAVASAPGARDQGEAFAPATAAARPTAADVDVAGGRLYYCDVHRSAERSRAAPDPASRRDR